MSAYEPGTVAVATVRGVPNVRVFCYRVRSGECQWDSAERVHGSISHGDADVTDVRPLVVLDLSSWLPEFVAAIPDWLRRHAPSAPSSSLVFGIADQIEQQTKPAKPAEPTGLGAVVVATCQCNNRTTFIREPLSARFEINTRVGNVPWKSACGHHQWSDLTDVEVKSEGWSR